jgi:carbamoyltransferase
VNILGINAVYHDPAAALLVDGELVVAVEEERFSRIKHGKLPDVDNPHQFPERSIRFCLEYAGLKPSDIDYVGYSFDPEIRRKQFDPNWWPNPKSEEVFRLRLAQVPSVADGILGRRLGQRFHFMPHHLAHAASAYFPSPFERAAVLTVDGIGETAGSTLAKATGTRIHSIETFEFPHSLGFVWEAVCGYLGFSPYDASKLMGLAAYGNPKTFRRQFHEMIRVGEDDYAVDQEASGFLTAKTDRMMDLLGPPREEGSELLQRHSDIAAALQESTNAAVAALVRRIKRKVPYDKLCFAGGVALNCVTNELIRQSGEFSDVFIPYCPHDAGTAIGAAYVAHCVNNKTPPVRGNFTPYLGPEFQRREILDAVKAAGFTPKTSKAPARDAAEMIADGKIVAWFQGRMEFGPRALGNRSLLADPRRPEMRNILNQKVKHREDFRPFAPSVMAEHANEWFEIGNHTTSHEFMLFACAAKAEQRDRIPAVLHHDGTGRLQLVSQKSNRRYHELISAFHAQTGVPLVINTSFNDREPIVCTPSDAIVTFRKSGIDALFMGDVYLTADG